MKKFPTEILVYQCDEVDGEPVYAVAQSVADIPEDIDGKKVGVYTINATHTFQIRRDLK